MYSFCLEHFELLQVYRLYNCFSGLKDWQGCGCLCLIDGLLLCLVEFSVSAWVSTFCITLHCVLFCAGSQPHWTWEEENSCWNTAKQFCWHPPVMFHSYSVNPWSLSTTWDSNANADGTSSWELARVKNFVKTGLAPKHQMFAALTTWKKLTPFLDDSWDNPKEKCQMQWLYLRNCVIWTWSCYVIWFCLTDFSVTGEAILDSVP